MPRNSQGAHGAHSCPSNKFQYATYATKCMTVSIPLFPNDNQEQTKVCTWKYGKEMILFWKFMKISLRCGFSNVFIKVTIKVLLFIAYHWWVYVRGVTRKSFGAACFLHYHDQEGMSDLIGFQWYFVPYIPVMMCQSWTVKLIVITSNNIFFVYTKLYS